MAGHKDASAFGKDVEAALQTLDQTLPTLIPSAIRNNPRFQSAVLAELIEAVGKEYGEAVEGGKLVNLIEYHDAFGFLQRVRGLVNQLADRLQA